MPTPLAADFAYPDIPVDVQMATLHCVVTTVDERGRLGDKSVIKRLGWQPGQPLSITVDRSIVKIRRAPDGPRLQRSGFLVLPAAVRNSCNLYLRDRVLLAASIEHEILVVYPPRAVTSALLTYFPDPWPQAL
jgi:bifunctional DNA-binding transcriptional regulator/antitoxin component of YhaV-PrlF toxin-antitoxin module